MRYLDQASLKDMGVNWAAVTRVIEDVVRALEKKEYEQPLKPYLRFGKPHNRIIAMPAYVGGNTNLSGIKWIASFPDNIARNVPRAHAVTILNDTQSGVPLCIINAALLSEIRTAAVSGLVLQRYLQGRRGKNPLQAGITGFGPIGRAHASMLQQVLGERLGVIRIFDPKGVQTADLDASLRRHVEVCSCWEEAYENADVFITCTVSRERYVNKTPKKGSLHLNVSLRDYQPDFYESAGCIVVDDWQEVCRENTDIELMHKQKGLMREDVYLLTDLVCNNLFDKLPGETVIMFNPKGMAVFDIAMGGYYYGQSIEQNKGVEM